MGAASRPPSLKVGGAVPPVEQAGHGAPSTWELFLAGEVRAGPGRLPAPKAYRVAAFGFFCLAGLISLIAILVKVGRERDQFLNWDGAIVQSSDLVQGYYAFLAARGDPAGCGDDAHQHQSACEADDTCQWTGQMCEDKEVCRTGQPRPGEEPLPTRAGGPPASITVLYEALDGGNILDDRILGYIQQFETELLTTANGALSRGQASPWSDQWCLKVYPAGGGEGKCAPVASPVSLFSMTDSGKSAVEQQVRQGYGLPGNLETCLCSDQPGLCSFCTSDGRVNQRFLQALGGNASLAPGLAASAGCVLSQVAAAAGALGATSPKLEGNVTTFLARRTQALQASGKLGSVVISTDFDLSFDLMLAQTAGIETGILWVSAMSPGPRFFPSISVRQNSTFLISRLDRPSSPVASCQSLFQLPLGQTSRVSASLRGSTFTLRVNGTVACTITQYKNEYASQEADVWATNALLPAKGTIGNMVYTANVSGSPVLPTEVDRLWQTFRSGPNLSVAVQAGNAVGQKQVTGLTLLECQALCDGTTGCFSVSFCDADGGLCSLWDRRLTGTEDAKPGGSCGTYFVAPPSAADFCPRQAPEDVASMDSVQAWLESVCGSSPSCQWSPLPDSAICGSRGFYPATDSQGLVTGDDKDRALRLLCNDGDEAWSNQRKLVFPRSFSCGDKQATFARTVFMPGKRDLNATSAGAEYEAFKSDYIQGKDGWYAKVRELESKVEHASGGRLRIMLSADVAAPSQAMEVFNQDFSMAVMSLVLAWMFMWWVLESFFLACCALLQVLFALSVSMCMWTSQGAKLTAQQVLVSYMLLGISANHVFVLHDGWKQAAYIAEGSDTRHWTSRYAWAYRRGLHSMVVTAAATCVCFLIGGAAPLPPVRDFCCFAALVVFMDGIFCATFFASSLILFERLFNSQNGDRPRAPGTCGGPGCCWGLWRLLAMRCRRQQHDPTGRAPLAETAEAPGPQKRALEELCEGPCFRLLSQWKFLFAGFWILLTILMAISVGLGLKPARGPSAVGKNSVDFVRASQVLQDEFAGGEAPTVSFVFGIDDYAPMRKWGSDHKGDQPRYRDRAATELATPEGQLQLLKLCRLPDDGKGPAARCEDDSCMVLGAGAKGRCPSNIQALRQSGVLLSTDPMCTSGRYCFMEDFARYWAYTNGGCPGKGQVQCVAAVDACLWDADNGFCFSRSREEQYPGLRADIFQQRLASADFQNYMEQRASLLRAAGRGYEVDRGRELTGFRLGPDGGLRFAWVSFNATFPKQAVLDEADAWYSRWENWRQRYVDNLRGFQTAELYLYLALQKEVVTAVTIGVGVQLAVAYIVLLVCTRNWQVAGLGVVNVAALSMVILGLVPLLGWDIGENEAFFLTALVGLAVNNTAHLLHRYRNDTSEVTREGRVRRVLADMGITVVNSSALALLGVVILFGCGFYYMMQFGAFVLFVQGFSLLMSITFLMPLALIVGPEHQFGDLPFCRRKVPEGHQGLEGTTLGARENGDIEADGDTNGRKASAASRPAGAVRQAKGRTAGDLPPPPARGADGAEDDPMRGRRKGKPIKKPKLRKGKHGKGSGKEGEDSDDDEGEDSEDDTADGSAGPSAAAADLAQGTDEASRNKQKKKLPTLKMDTSEKKAAAFPGGGGRTGGESLPEEASSSSPAVSSGARALAPPPVSAPAVPSSLAAALAAATAAAATPSSTARASTSAAGAAVPSALAPPPRALPKMLPRPSGAEAPGAPAKPAEGLPGPAAPTPPSAAAAALAPLPSVKAEAASAAPDAKTIALGKLQELLASDPSAAELEAGLAEARVAGVTDSDAKDASKRLEALKATAALVEAVAGRDPASLKVAIAAAESAGIAESELVEAKAILQEEEAKRLEAERLQREAAEAKAKAAEALAKAVAARDVAALVEAIAAAEREQLPAADIEAAKRVVAEEEVKVKAREKLASIRGSPDAATLKAGLEEAQAAGIAGEPLFLEVEASLAGLERRLQSEAALRAAMAAPTVAGLQAAIEEAKVAGADPALVAEGEAALAKEEQLQQARDKLEEACQKCTKEALQEAIPAAREAGVEEALIGKAEALLAREEEKARLLAAVTDLLEESKKIDMTSIDVVRDMKERLSQAIVAATAIGVPEVELQESELRRKKLHNTIEDLKGSIRVFCRIRPLSSKEKDQGDHNVTKQTDPMTLQVDDGEKSETFQFDAVFTPGTQEQIFEDCRDLVQSAVDGYNVTLFAYGQTGAGKTFTMAGVPGQEGVSPRTIKEIFDVIERGKSRCDYTVNGSMLELHRQDLVDLLSKGDTTRKTRSKPLNVRVDNKGTVVIENLTEEVCTNAEELSNLLARGNEMRSVAATEMNSESSRSHLVLIIKITSVNRETSETLRGKILIVDLAGSERLKKSQTTADMQKESIEINKSLTALGDVIEALTKNQKQIPYRNHKLTQLMQDSLGGTAKTLMFVNCSPANSNSDETLMSLKYAARAKKITNATAKNA